MAASPAAPAANAADIADIPADTAAEVVTDAGTTSSGVVSSHQNFSHSTGLVYLHPQHTAMQGRMRVPSPSGER